MMRKLKKINKKKLAIYIAFTISIIIYIFNEILLIRSVASPSMGPSLIEGKQYVFINSRVHSDIERGDIVLFYNNELDELNNYSDALYCKRVIGIAGDTILFTKGKVCVNGEIIDETYLLDGEDTICYNDETYVVPEGKVFVLGDNRHHSIDSRYLEDPYINISDIVCNRPADMF